MCKEVGGYLTQCARIAASIALNDESLLSQSVTYLGIELLGQLKMPHFAQYPVLTPGQSDSYAIPKQRPTDQVAMSGDENTRDPVTRL